MQSMVKSITSTLTVGKQCGSTVDNVGFPFTLKRFGRNLYHFLPTLNSVGIIYNTSSIEHSAIPNEVKRYKHTFIMQQIKIDQLWFIKIATHPSAGHSPSVVVVGAEVLLFGRLNRGPIRSVIGRLRRKV